MPTIDRCQGARRVGTAMQWRNGVLSIDRSWSRPGRSDARRMPLARPPSMTTILAQRAAGGGALQFPQKGWCVKEREFCQKNNESDEVRRLRHTSAKTGLEPCPPCVSAVWISQMSSRLSGRAYVGLDSWHCDADGCTHYSTKVRTPELVWPPHQAQGDPIKCDPCGGKIETPTTAGAI